MILNNMYVYFLIGVGVIYGLLNFLFWSVSNKKIPIIYSVGIIGISLLTGLAYIFEWIKLGDYWYAWLWVLVPFLVLSFLILALSFKEDDGWSIFMSLIGLIVFQILLFFNGHFNYCDHWSIFGIISIYMILSAIISGTLYIYFRSFYVLILSIIIIISGLLTPLIFSRFLFSEVPIYDLEWYLSAVPFILILLSSIIIYSISYVYPRRLFNLDLDDFEDLGEEEDILVEEMEIPEEEFDDEFEYEEDGGLDLRCYLEPGTISEGFREAFNKKLYKIGPYEFDFGYELSPIEELSEIDETCWQIEGLGYIIKCNKDCDQLYIYKFDSFIGIVSIFVASFSLISLILILFNLNMWFLIIPAALHFNILFAIALVRGRYYCRWWKKRREKPEMGGLSLAEVEKIREEMGRLRRDLDSFSTKTHELERKQQENQGKVGSFKDEIEEIRGDLLKVRSKSGNIELSNQESSDRLKLLKAEVKDFRGEFSAVQTKAKASEASLNGVDKRIEKLQNEVKDFRGELSAVKNKAEASEASLNGLDKRIEKLQNEVDELRKALSEVSSRINQRDDIPLYPSCCDGFDESGDD